MVQITVPDWIVHRADAESKRSTIYTLSVHPDGTRLATGGLDTKVRVWATAPILDASDNDTPHLLSTLARHTGAVLAVRWSHSGRYLASGSDDTVALIWELDETSGGGGFSFGSNEANVETWRPHRRLAGHESDVTDLSWSESDALLATVGLDSLVMLWSGDTFDRLRTIRGHHGFIKGVAFDPLEQFLATSSDDRTVKVWRTRDWGLEASVTEPFEHAPSSTFFHRLSWTPDGMNLMAANAMNGPVFVSSVLRRLAWTSEISLVGHENAVSVAACSPRLFVGDTGPRSVVALGSLDQSISVWLTGTRRPIIVARDLFERHVMDMGWSADGYTLYACSSDGTVAALAFMAEDLAPTLSDDDCARERAHHGLSRTPKRLAHTPLARPVSSLERPQMLVARKGPTERLVQHITRGPDGKRRIRPTTLSAGAAPEADEAPSAPIAKLPRTESRGRTLGDSTRTPLTPATPLAVALPTGTTPSSAAAALPLEVLSTLSTACSDGTVEVRNATEHASQVTFVCGERVQWTDFVSAPVVAATASDTFVSAALLNGTLLWYSRRGRRLSTLALDVPCVRLASHGNILAALMHTGCVRRWNVPQCVAVGEPVALPGADDLTILSVHSNGVPIAVLREREEVVALDDRLGAFVCVASGALARRSDAWDVRLRGRGVRDVREPIKQAESELNDLIVARPATCAAVGDEALAATLRHLEMRLQAAELLASPAEYQQALLALGRRLSDEGIRNQAEDLLRAYMGPVYYRPGITESWKPSVLGLDKRELLSSLLAAMST